MYIHDFLLHDLTGIRTINLMQYATIFCIIIRLVWKILP